MTDEFDEPAQPKTELPEHHYHSVLTNAEFLAAQAKARKTIEADRKKAAMKAVEEAESERLRVEEGLVTGSSSADEIVSILVDLAPYCDRLTLNFRSVYMHGRTYTVPRHVADTLRDMMYRTWQHQNEIDGKSLRFLQGQHRVANIDKIKGATVGSKDL